MFDVQKMIQVVNHIISKYEGQINYTKLIKELYLADKECLFKHGYLITDNDFVCMKMGPVLEDLYRLIRGQYSVEAAQVQWNSYFYTSSFDLLKAVDNRLPEDRLTANEIHVLDEVDERCHHMDYIELTRLVHNPAVCPETVLTDSSINLPVESIMAKAGISPEVIDAWGREKRLQNRLDRILA